MSTAEQKPAEYTELFARFHSLINSGVADERQARDFIVLNHRVLGEYEKLVREWRQDIKQAKQEGRDKYSKQLEDRRDEVLKTLLDTSSVPESREAALKLATRLSQKLAVNTPGALNNNVSLMVQEFRNSDNTPDVLSKFLNQSYVNASGTKLDKSAIPATDSQIDQVVNAIFDKSGLEPIYGKVDVTPAAQEAFLSALGDDEALGVFLEQESEQLFKGINVDGYLNKLKMRPGSEERKLMRDYIEGGAEAAIYRKYAQSAARGAQTAAEQYDSLTNEQRQKLYLTNNKLALDTARQALADQGITKSGVIQELTDAVDNPVAHAGNKFIYAVGKLEPSLEAMQQVAQHFGTVDPRTGRRMAYSRSRDQDSNPFIAQAKERTALRDEMPNNPQFMAEAARLGIPLREGERPTPR